VVNIVDNTSRGVGRAVDTGSDLVDSAVKSNGDVMKAFDQLGDKTKRFRGKRTGAKLKQS